MMQDFMMMREMFGSNGMDWLAIALMLSLFAICVFKPERIRKRLVFRWACILLAFSIIAPHLTRVALQSMQMGIVGSGRINMYSDPTLGSAYAFTAALRPCCLAASVLLGLMAISPRTNPKGKRAEVVAPAKHPLD